MLKTVVRKRGLISKKTVNLDYFVSKTLALIINEQIKASQIMVKAGELVL